ncbi:surface antigen BspA-like [Trichomonas vaginalis G3]|uniref:Surface antigen BspA-like n=1 Tax=Trichomonas vaginalis (strain ATCC PRA-98 / G3) TaxID=412133 RepID=A2EKQ4_TRIV3|nr:leucine-rich repeats (6 copies)-containing protein [Trichomonas vaginalis G3]EAY06793.1 surface antigen BspA-like [Trichomonas vaginalis G3]KAI5485847.1 leucine-rich repeats (6 copies)-containing protein [Trichomonas vaginalis G3]|eukprot:XP_001319016.1 surface antigen BspA-like [Trichomonas vaginalis G3]
MSINNPEIVQKSNFIGYKYRIINLKIESGVKRVENYAFEDFTILETINLSENVEYFSSSATLNCKNLFSIIVSQNNPYFYNDADMNLYTKNQSVLIRVMPKNPKSGYPRNFTIPSSVTVIQQYAFANTDIFEVKFEETSNISTLGILSFSLSELSFITIPSTVTSIQNQSFYKCHNLEQVTFEENTNTQKQIGYESFSYTSIKEFVFPYNCYVHDDIFSHCKSLTKITIQDSSTAISVNTFSGCLSITSISTNSDKYNYSLDHLFNVEKTNLYYIAPPSNRQDYVDSVNYSLVEEFCNTAFLNKNNLPNTNFSHYCIKSGVVYDLNSYNVISCLKYVQQVILDDNSRRICKICFLNKNIIVQISQNLISIEFEAFYECTVSFTEQRFFPSSLKLIEASAFQNSKISNNIYFNSSEELIIQDSAFENAVFQNDANIAFTNVLTSLGKRCFFGAMIKVISINIQGSISMLQDYSFANSKLIQLTIPFSIKSIGTSVFENCINLTTVSSVTRISVQSLVIRPILFCPNIETFGEFAFLNCCNLWSINIGSSTTVKYIGSYAFHNITNLYSVTIGLTDEILTNETFYSPNLMSFKINDKNKFYSTQNNCTYNKNKTVLLWSTPLIDNLIINSSTEIISDYAFYNRTKLDSVTYSDDYSALKIVGHCAFSFNHINSFRFYNNITILGNLSFYMCESLTLIIIPEGSNLEYIGDLCFYKNGFRIISIPSKCSYIGMFAFKESKNLNTVNFAENSQCKQINSGFPGFARGKTSRKSYIN